MFYVGLDVHSSVIAVCVLDAGGQVVRRTKVRQLDQLVPVFELLQQPFQVCFEASCGYGRIAEFLQRYAARVVVAHPGQLSLIFRSKRKHDRIDAEKLAKLLALDMVPAVHVPHADVRAWREAINFRSAQIGKRTRVKNELRALLRSQGIVPPKRPGIWTKKGIEWLKALSFDQPLLRLRRNQLVLELEFLTQSIQQVEVELAKYSADDPRVELLQTIPGVGPRTAEALVAFIDKADRFSNAKAVGAYFGLVPCQDQSGGPNRLGRITREGAPVVRKLVTEAAWQGLRRSPTIRAYFDRIVAGGSTKSDKDRRKIALVATAHYLGACPSSSGGRVQNFLQYPNR